MKVALFQYSPSPDMQSNSQTVLGLMERASSKGADLVLTPEVCLSPFFAQHPERDVSHYAIGIDDEIIKGFQEACRRHRVAASPNVYLQEGGARYDASLLIDARGELLGISKMVHVCQAPQFYEQDYYTPSDTGFRVFDTDFGKIGIVICFDRHLPESIRTCALRGAELILIPTANTSGEPQELFEWELRVAAFQNGVNIACCNRVGTEDAMEFYGESMVVDPDGNVVARAGASEELLIAEIDPTSVRNSKARQVYLPLRRPEAYER